jgi:copper transport protein
LTRAALVAAAAALAALVLAPGAAAHATLVSAEPANDAVLAEPPAQVTLRFNEPVESAFGSVRVFDAAARRVDDGDVGRPDRETVSVGVDGELADGTYTVTWRVVSADSHPVAGAFVFHVGEPGANPGGIAEQVLDGGTPRHVTVLFTFVRFLDFALLLLVAGGAAALATSLRDAAPGLRDRLLGALVLAAAALAVVALAGIVVQGAYAGGLTLADAATRDGVSAVLDTRFGEAWLAQAGIALAVALLALAARGSASDRLVYALLAPAAVLTALPALSGHANVSGGISLVTDVAHVAAAAVWTGGLAFLVGALLAAREERWELAARAVPRFSTLAVGAVAVLIVAGTINAYEQVGAWRGLWDTTYGLLLLAKIALVLPLLALGAYNNRAAVPRLRARIADVTERRRFLRVAGAELALFVAVVGVTAVLVTEPPARASVAPTGPFAGIVALGDLEANVVVDPAVAGDNELHVYLSDRNGRPVDLEDVRLAATLASRGIGPLRFETRRLAPGHYTVDSAQLPLAGDWQLTVQGRRGDFEVLEAKLSAPVRAP